MPDHLTEADEVTLRLLAIAEKTNFAEQRRRALSAYAQKARQDKNIAEAVRLILASRRERGIVPRNVIALRRAGDG